MKENGLLGRPHLHGRLYLSSCILAELLKQSPAALHPAQPAEEAGDPAGMTLADLFSALLFPSNGQNNA